MSRRKWLWISLAAIPLVTAAAFAAASIGSIPTPQASQPPQVEPASEDPTCCRPDCCKDCPPDCPPEACPLCTK